ncbi:acetylornithine deacetylase [Microbacterium sp. CSI-V]|uniref:M20/M25/M40 family metallo-hydrolase n=1 Tax=unclassified Microbacterium TaxID=2609290 RepID=UPI00097BEC1A|nr:MULTISPECIES: M20/M25/M40 family metallo-hydrolase [unclassified Microbacterium]MXS73926.1 M20/M25/M40 family metallo-hydrolase [Microbacterium sp. TL13]ONI62531.1 acetylornithine deacetylase [Microbacterium sp. CSI-V]
MTPVERFRELLAIPTVSYVDPTRTDTARFDEFHAALERLYPLVHAHLEREIVAGHALLYRWRGVSSLDPLLLLAHQDVVDTAGQPWTRDPFGAVVEGEGTDATLYARGAIDDKGALVAILEAVEQALTEGVVPRADVWLAFGHDEETLGEGARAIAALLAERGVRPALVLDEGGAVVEGALPGVGAPTAMIGVAERGSATFELIAREAGGHASTPPSFPATARLARAIDRVRRRPFPRRLVPPVRAMLASAAAHAPEPVRSVFRRTAVTAPVLTAAFALLGPETNALVRTTAVVTRLEGSAGDNVLATTARATVNVRLLTGETISDAAIHLRRAIDDPLIDIELRHGSDPSPVSPWQGTAWRRLAVAVAETLGDDVIPLPYLQLGASDSRFYAGLTDHVYRFTPFHLTRAERDALHAPDERIRVEVWLRGIGFYRALLAS